MSEPRRLRRGEGYGACDAAAQMKLRVERANDVELALK